MNQTGSHHRYATMAAPLAAALGCLQPGIDPVFLALLAQSSHLPPTALGVIVGGTQSGAAIGSLVIWRLGPKLPHGVMLFAALVALCCSVATAPCRTLVAILPLRCCYGLAMGMVYAYAMAAYAVRMPNRAFGAVFLTQLVLSTLVSLALPTLEATLGARVALAALALAPGAAFVALLLLPISKDGPGHGTQETASAAVPAIGWALAAATFWFVCATMLIWSFSAALASAAGIADRTIGTAVAIGSISGALTAVAVMRERLLLPLPLTALLAGASLLSPIVLTSRGSDVPFVVSIILLNIGSTAIIIRCSGLAVATSTDRRFRTFVACTHSLGLIAGPLVGTVMLIVCGPSGLLVGLLLALSAGFATVLWGGFTESRRGHAGHSARMSGDVEMALD